MTILVYIMFIIIYWNKWTLTNINIPTDQKKKKKSHHCGFKTHDQNMCGGARKRPLSSPAKVNLLDSNILQTNVTYPFYYGI